MNSFMKHSVKWLGLGLIMTIAACAVVPGDGPLVYNNGYSRDYNSGFLVGDYYYYNDQYYPINYYTNNGQRYYRPDFDRPYRYNPDQRYRDLSAQEINAWRNRQTLQFDPSYRPTINNTVYNNQVTNTNNNWSTRNQVTNTNNSWSNRNQVINNQHTDTINNNHVTQPIASTNSVAPIRPPVYVRPTIPATTPAQARPITMPTTNTVHGYTASQAVSKVNPTTSTQINGFPHTTTIPSHMVGQSQNYPTHANTMRPDQNNWDRNRY